MGGSTYLTFDSKKPHGGDVEGVCRRNQLGLLDAVTQMCLDVSSKSHLKRASRYIAGEVDVSSPEAEKMGYRLSYGQIDVDEKRLDRNEVSRADSTAHKGAKRSVLAPHGLQTACGRARKLLKSCSLSLES